MGLYDTTIGTLLVGIFFNTFLYGLVTYQFAAYYRIKFNDRPAVKYMVLFLFILDTFHSASVIYLAWYYTVANYNNPAALAVGEWPFTFTPIATALTALVTQLYLGFRIWCLTSCKFLYGVVILLAINSFILGVICSADAWAIQVLSELPRITPIAIAWFTIQVVVDAFITITLIIIFSRSRTGFRKTDTVLNRLIRGAIQTGLFTGIFSMADLITFVVLPNTNVYVMFAIPLGRIYTNTLLDTLLARESLKAEMDGTDHVSGALCSLHWNITDPLRTTSTSIQLEAQTTVQKACDRSACEGVAGNVVPPEV